MAHLMRRTGFGVTRCTILNLPPVHSMSLSVEKAGVISLRTPARVAGVRLLGDDQRYADLGRAESRVMPYVQWPVRIAAGPSVEKYVCSPCYRHERAYAPAHLFR